MSVSDESSWQILFDGQSTSGWHSYGKASAGSAWKASGGELWLDASRKEAGKVVNGGDLVTDHSYENFQLQLEWKLAAGGNSGIIFLVEEDLSRYERSWQSGPEMQLLDNQGHPDGHLPRRRSGDLYDLIAAGEDANKPVGEWNKTEINCLNGQLQIFLNQIRIISAQLWTPDWQALIQQSKFKSYEGFGTYKRGRIALQDHGHPVWFRHIRIRHL